jgi:asparagine synthase (glutamine-hydrolysing)
MCGIAGIFSLNQNEIRDGSIERMAAAIRHRGPDEEGFLKKPLAHFAIERLKVIDLKTGQQPIFNETKTVGVVFNGEIYNYKELRQNLEARGHHFSTQTDTETIVHLYEEYREDCVHHLNGMFAFALWDEKNETVLLARDPSGIKPLFYGTFNGQFLFASEIKALLAIPGFPRVIRPEALTHYLSYYYVTSPMTIYQDIHRLPAGSRIIGSKGNIRVERYWDLTFKPDASRSLGEWKERFVQTLDQSVQRHLQSDVPLGIFLSGGLDSASLVAMASRHQSPLNTYTIGYAEKSYSELKEARAVAVRYGTRHQEIILTPQEFSETLPAVVSQLDEPQGDWSAVPNFVLSKAVKKTATVVLSGAGGDELLGGYPTFLAAKIAHGYRRLPSWFRAGVISPMVDCIPVGKDRMSLHFMAKSFLRGAAAPPERAHQRFKEVFNSEERRLLVTPSARAVLDSVDPFEAFSQYAPQYESMSEMDRLFYLDFKVFMADCTLPVVDLTSSAHAVECRVPFLDKTMLDLASQMPSWYKVRRWTTKYLFREAMRSFLPPEVVAMKKKGFLIPGAPWMAGPLKPMILEVMSEAEGRLGHLFNFPYIQGLIRDHFEGRADHTRRISCFISLAMWDAQFKPSWPESLLRNTIGVS